MKLNQQEQILRKSIPVVINSFNQPRYLANIVHRFRVNHFHNIVIVDNASTDDVTCELLQKLSKQDITVIHYGNNYGPRHFHQSGMYKFLGRGYHFFTDPDLDFDTLADDFVQRFISVSEEHKKWKVGSALTIPPDHLLRTDLEVYFQETNRRCSIKEWETEVGWSRPMGNGLYDSAVDTTLHLFNPEWYPIDSPWDYYSAIRIDGPGYAVRHLPWYNNDILGSEQYTDSRNSWNTWKKKDVKQSDASL